MSDSEPNTTPKPEKKTSLARSSSIVSIMTLLSRVLGLVRDVVVAQYFGARADAFFVAFKIPNFLRRLFAEGAFSVAFVPVLSEYKTQRSLTEVKFLIASVSGVLGLTLFLVTLVALLLAPWLPYVFAPGFSDDAAKFAAREVRRERRYDGIILDPPKFGRGPKGETWRIEEGLPPLIADCRQLLDETSTFLFLTVYAVRMSSLAIGELVRGHFADLGGKVEVGELAVREEARGLLLPTAIYARWSAD